MSLAVEKLCPIVAKQDSDTRFPQPITTQHWTQLSKTIAADKHFADITDKELAVKRAKLVPKNTKCAEKCADNRFKIYLKATGIENYEDWTQFGEKPLDECLVKFWFTLRTKKGEYLSLTNLQNFKHSLNDALKCAGRKIDITKDPQFINSQEAYKDAARELKQKGKAVIRHYPEIIPSGKKNLQNFDMKQFI